MLQTRELTLITAQTIVDKFGYLYRQFTFTGGVNALTRSGLDQLEFSAYCACIPGTKLLVEGHIVVGVSPHPGSSEPVSMKMLNTCPACGGDLYFPSEGVRCSNYQCLGRLASRITFFMQSPTFRVHEASYEMLFNIVSSDPSVRACTDILSPDFLTFSSEGHLPTFIREELYSARYRVSEALTTFTKSQSDYRFFLEVAILKALCIDGVTDRELHRLVSIGMSNGDPPFKYPMRILTTPMEQITFGLSPTAMNILNWEEDRLRIEAVNLERLVDADMSPKL